MGEKNVIQSRVETVPSDGSRSPVLQGLGLRSGQTFSIWGELERYKKARSFWRGWAEQPGVSAFSFPVADLTGCRYIYIPQGCQWIIRCLFCFQPERPFRGADAFYCLLDRSRFDGCDLQRGKNGVSAWRWLTDAVNLSQPLKIKS